ncbi:MAG: TetR/AcrR family transcriptional regulator [Actinomycetota bacterium]
MAKTATNPSPRSTYHHGNLSETLVSAGLAIAAEGGPEALSLREAARRAGVSPTAVYRHFDNRAALVTAVKHVVLARLAAAMGKALARPLPRGMDATECSREHLIRIGSAYVDFALANPGEYRVIFSEATFPYEPQRSADGECGPADPYGILSTVLDEMVVAGALAAEKRPGAEVPMWALVHGLSSLILQGPYADFSRRERAAMVDQSLRLVISGMPRDVP